MSDQGQWGQPTPPTPPGSGPSFAPPSNPGFRDQTMPPVSPQQPSWPSAGTVPFVGSGRAPRGSAITALLLAIVGAVVGLAIGWGFPLSIVALVFAMNARRKPGSSRGLATWTVALVVVSVLASAVWLVYSILYILG